YEQIALPVRNVPAARAPMRLTMRFAAIVAVVLVAACATPRPRDEALQAAYAAAEAEATSLEARLRESEQARQQAQARAKELEQARDLSERLSAELRRLEAQVAALKAHETARGLGPAYPVAANSDPRGRSLNRRVEILIGETVGRAATGASSRGPK